MATYINFLETMSIAERLTSLRKHKGLTQQALADAIGLHVTQVKRYEHNQSQPSLDTLKKIAKALRVSIDSLVFDESELLPDDSLALQFKAVTNLPKDQQAVIKQLLEGMIIKYEAERWSSSTK
ncbi:hypothetical protein MNBD_GAMMA03-724 [hydrothermal vent metagenome]|uniref:HTH cro/C1-type domain-containing protein n=1 Tax=hydrothermal vent metagenome TaxID=652676 RepID=A0A3B0W5X3_9ZZZZ